MKQTTLDFSRAHTSGPTACANATLVAAPALPAAATTLLADASSKLQDLVDKVADDDEIPTSKRGSLLRDICEIADLLSSVKEETPCLVAIKVHFAKKMS